MLDVCQLTLKTLEAKLKVDKSDPNPKADLIVFPEVSVQISISTADIDLAAFKRKVRIYKETKAKPAGMD